MRRPPAFQSPPSVETRLLYGVSSPMFWIGCVIQHRLSPLSSVARKLRTDGYLIDFTLRLMMIS